MGAAGDPPRPGPAGPDASRCSRCPTATWAGAATWTRASRTACRAAISTGSTRRGRCRTPRRPTAARRPGKTVINVTNGKLIRLFVDDEPFDVRYGELRCARADARLPRRGAEPHAPSGCRRPGRRSGSPRSGWCRSPSGRSRRSATRWSRSTARRGSRCSPSCSPTSSCRRPSGDPRVAAALENPLVSEYHDADGTAVVLVHRPGAAGCASAPRWTT